MIKNISLPFKIAKSFFQVRNIMKGFSPDAVIGVGGYSSFPVLRYAQSKGIPTFIHESNSFAGKSNIMLGKKATSIFVASDGMEKFFPKEKLMITGNPVRKTIVQSTVSKRDGLLFFGLDENRKTVFVTGGSLGARSINEAIANQLGDFESNNLQLIWQTGKTTAKEYMAKGTGRQNVWVNEFITDMQYAFAAADVVISRSGAMAIAELCVAKKAAVFVPYPLAAEDHQTANAQNLVNKNAGLMIKDNEAKEKLVATVVELMKNESLQNDLKQNIARLAITDADDKIAGEILRTIEN